MRATEVVFLPGFDGVAELRRPFLEELARRFKLRAITYPNESLQTLNGYARYASGQVSHEARPVLVAESFSGLVAARWAARDSHVAGVILCGAFARNPMTWVTSLGASIPSVVQLGTHLMRPVSSPSAEPLRHEWSKGLTRTLRELQAEVIGERLRIIASEDIGSELAALRIPVALVQFDDDLVIGPRARRELEAACPQAQVIRFDGPHFAIETHPVECADVIAMQLHPLF